MDEPDMVLPERLLVLPSEADSCCTESNRFPSGGPAKDDVRARVLGVVVEISGGGTAEFCLAIMGDSCRL